MSEENKTLTNDEVNVTEEESDNLLSEDTLEIVEEDKKFHLDPTSGEDRRKILASYKKSLRKRAFSPLIGGNVGINPIDLMKEEEAQKSANNQTLDIYDLTEKRIADMEKKVSQATFMARLAFGVSVFSLLMLLFLLSVTKFV